MNQTPAAMLVLAASVLSYGAYAATTTSHGQASVILTLSAIALGLWGVVSLISACVRERELLIDGHARLDMLDRVLVREPLQAIKSVVRPTPARASGSPEPQRPLQISAELQAQLNSLAQLEGRDRSEILEEILRRQLPKYSQSRVA